MAAETKVQCKVILVPLACGSFNLPDQFYSTTKIDNHFCANGGFIDRGSIADKLDFQPMICTAR